MDHPIAFRFIIITFPGGIVGIRRLMPRVSDFLCVCVCLGLDRHGTVFFGQQPSLTCQMMQCQSVACVQEICESHLPAASAVMEIAVHAQRSQAAVFKLFADFHMFDSTRVPHVGNPAMLGRKHCRVTEGGAFLF